MPLWRANFGPLFERRPAIDWTIAGLRPCVTYVSLSATAASEDVELLGRVILQDLKQLCAWRLRHTDQGVPLLVIFDEFAALREASQMVDLLLQAWEARMPVCVSTQYIPEDIRLRIPLLQSSVLVVHRVGADDAEQVAKELGTREVPFVTQEVDLETGESTKGSVRANRNWLIHPDELRTLPVGSAAVYSSAPNAGASFVSTETNDRTQLRGRRGGNDTSHLNRVT